MTILHHTLDIQRRPALPMPPAPVVGPSAWYASDFATTDNWIDQLSPTDIDDLDRAIHGFVSTGRSLGEISRKTFPLPTLGIKLQHVLDELLHGRGFALIRGFPVRRYTTEQAALAYLGIGSYLGNFRSQNAKGHLLGHVKDLGLDIAKPTTRYYQTNRHLEYHTDSCDIVGLLCLKASRSGGESRIVSSVTLYNEIRKRRPDLLSVLFRAFPTDRRGEVPIGMKPWFDVPIFNWFDGLLTTLYVGQYIRAAQTNYPEARRLTPEEVSAIDYLDELSNDPSIHLQMEFRPGDMQFLHNHAILHSRTDFEDWPEPERRRHLLRLWLAPLDARRLPDYFVPRYGSVTPGDRGGIITRETRLKFVLEAE
jgi:hypothetical protein